MRLPLFRTWIRLAPLQLLLMAGLAGTILTLQAVKSEVLEGEVLPFDTAALLWLRNPQNLASPIGPHWLEHAAVDLTSLGGVTVLSLVTILVTIYMLVLRKFALAAFVFFSVATGWLVSSAMKTVIARPRPEIVPHLMQVSDLSFPSGHAMVSAVTYLTLGALLARLDNRPAVRICLMSMAVFLTLIIGLSRVYLGVHYPTDVLAGWCAGSLWAALCLWVAHRLIFTGGGGTPASKEEMS